MTVQHVLVAVEDSPAGIEAARVAVRMAGASGAELRAVHVLADGVLERALASRPDGTEVRRRRDAGAAAVLQHVAGLAHRAGVPVETVILHGRPAACVLDQARTWPADLVVIGRVGTANVGQPYVGSEVHHVLEFSDVPVLVVPPPSHRHGGER